ncbi:UDP-glucose 4-epimerase [Kiloniella spongiae]|uniref:UDP-glucose 4-epimerase n=1 Tax=Kiloniella spongiae TaxID=1489064 RepID=A0A0H2MQL0_9PROT|nr:polysaccharide biosynthesis protein [Kiloniella spongiae]KLN58955.1 UDP-glucose 4-epimerase [Kiloniella spongiae]
MTSLKNKTVLITGGTGSFGRAVTKRLLAEGEISRIIVFSRDEKKQHDMRLTYTDPRLDFEIGDVRDERRLFRVMKGVDMVFHAAALKHVPACEFFPMEAVKTNIIGTDNVIDAVQHHGVEKVVVLSTDKAAYPVNAMGCSKMMMEKVMIARAQAHMGDTNSILCGVRYGNVLFSRGSVLPLFFDQIRQGRPLTITNPDMTRFLMPLSDAIELVLHALRNGNTGDLFIHKAKAANIATVAKACLKLAGADNPVKIIGIRGGEKMDETLATSEELARAEDQGHYWRIPCEHGHDPDRFLSDGKPKVSDTAAFTSANAEQMNEATICEMLQPLPEFMEIITSV